MPAYIDNTICKKLNPTPLYVYKNLRNETGVSHSHDFIELTFIYEGRGEYEIDGRIYPVKTGDLLFISPGISHTTRITSGSLGLYSIAFTDVSFCQMPENTFFFEKEGPVYACPAKTAEKYDEIFTTMLKENTTNLPGKYFLMQSHLIQLLILIYRSINCPESALKKNITDGRLFPSGKKQLVNEIKNYLNDHYMDKISLDGIAQNMYLSPVYISRIFKEETGISPIHYLIEVRLKKAASLLRDTSFKIQDIAAMTGYDNVYHFSRIFKNHFHISPKAYREQSLTFHKKPVE